MADRRELSHRWYEAFDERRMTLTILTEDETEWTVPAEYVVCGTCEGRGTHVNPSIDSHGLSADDFAEDPDFAEDYHRGVYDEPCVECGGTRVVPMPTRLTPQEQAAVDRVREAHYAREYERAHEREMGY